MGNSRLIVRVSGTITVLMLGTAVRSYWAKPRPSPALATTRNQTPMFGLFELDWIRLLGTSRAIARVLKPPKKLFGKLGGRTHRTGLAPGGMSDGGTPPEVG